MNTWIALFRGINVGGKNLLKMNALVAELTALKLQQIQTYIQSGNVVFQCPAKTTSGALSKKISNQIEKQHGFRPDVLLLTLAEFRKAIDNNPFPDATSDPKSLHFFFLASKPSAPKLTALADEQAASESFELLDNVFYLHAPNGVGRSKLAAKVERHLGVPTTARNFRTVEKLLTLADHSGASS